MGSVINRIDQKISVLETLRNARLTQAKRLDARHPSAAAKERQYAATLAFAIMKFKELREELEHGE